ncbi:hypothetical protein PSTT_00604, partial [Puccinia striiformis]
VRDKSIEWGPVEVEEPGPTKKYIDKNRTFKSIEMCLMTSLSLPRTSSFQVKVGSTNRCFSSSPSPSVWVQKRIKVQLRSDHPIHGKAGRVIRVKPGHMRQQLYPTGQALYCANDGIPIHHYQPTSQVGLRVPAPGLSRPISELIDRLGVEMSITGPELRAAQAQIDEWKRRANTKTIDPIKPPRSRSSPSPTPTTSSPSASSPSSSALTPPKGLAEHLQKLSLASQASETPFLVFKRSGPETSETLYSSIKADQIIASLVDKLDFQRSSSPPDLPQTPIIDLLKIARCSLSAPVSDAQDPPQHRFKPIKSAGSYDIDVELLNSSSSKQIYTFTILVSKQ